MKKSIVLLVLFLIIGHFNIFASNDVYWGWEQSPLTNELKTIKLNKEGHIYIGVWGDGVYKSEDKAANFTKKSTGLTNLYITSIQIDSSGALWAATYGGGVFRSFDDGFTWGAVNNGLRDLKIKDIAFDKDGDGYAATKGKGMFILKNGTSQWVEINNKLRYRDVNKIIIVNSNGSVLAGTNGGGVYRTRDKGITWERANTGIRYGIITDFYQDDLMVYVATLGQGILQSLHDGSSWSNIDNTNLPKNATCIAFNNNKEMLAGSIDDGVWYHDKWVTDVWRKSAQINSGINAMVTLPTGEIFALESANGLKRSTDGGRNFWFVTAFRQDFIKELVADGNTLYCIAGTAPWRSDDRGETWTKLTIPFQTAYCLCIDSAKSLYVGSNAGVWKSTDKGANFNRFGTNMNDSVIYRIEASPNGVILASSTHIFKMEQTSTTWTRRNISTGENPPAIHFFGINKNNDIYANDMNLDALWKSTDTASRWTLLFFNDGKTYESIDFNRNMHVFIGSNQGLLVSTNHGANWDTFTFHPRDIAVNRVVVDKNQNVFVSVAYTKLLLSSHNYSVRRDTIISGIWWSMVNSMAASNNGFTYLSNSQVYRRVDSLEMPTPQLLSPPNDTNGITLKPSFKWKSADKAQLYHFQFAMDPDFESIIEEAYLADTTWQLENELQHRELYYWRVRTKHNSSYSPWSNPSYFRTIFEPPTLHLPEKGITSLPLEVSLHWYKMKDINSYMVQVAKDSLFKDIVFSQDNVVDTSAIAKGLTHHTVYYWRVRAKTIDVIGEWSEVWNFRTLLLPPKLRKPANKSYGHETVVKMEWDAVPGGTKYNIDISLYPDFSSLFFSSATQNDDSHTIDLLEYFKTYYWRISAIDEKEKPGDWSEVWSYTTIIDSTTLRLPDDGIKNTSTTVSFEWDTKAIATTYHLQIAEDANMTKLVVNDSTITGNKFTGEFQHYTQYYWRIAVKSGDFKGKWSVTWKFMTGIGRPELSSPPNNAEKQPTVLYLIWKKTNGAQSYHLQLSKEASFTTRILDEDKIGITQRDIIDLELDTKYFWRVRANYEEGLTLWSDTWEFTTTDVESVADANPILSKIVASPNPFSDFTNIEYNLKQDSDISISIFDVNGSLLHKENIGLKTEGTHNYLWNASNIPAGVYNIVLNSGLYSSNIRIVLIK